MFEGEACRWGTRRLLVCVRLGVRVEAEAFGGCHRAIDDRLARGAVHPIGCAVDDVVDRPKGVTLAWVGLKAAAAAPGWVGL